LIVFTILAVVAQAQAQPGAESSPKPASGSPSTADPNRVVLKVGDLQITQAAFEQYIADLEAQQGPADLSRKQLGDNYAAMLMFSHMAAANGLDQSPEVKRQLEIDRTQILSNAEFAKLKAAATPTPAEIKAYYDAHLDDYDVVYMQRIFIWTDLKPGEVRKGSQMTMEQAQKLAADIKQTYASGGDYSQIQKLVNDVPHTPEEVVIDKEPLMFYRGELPERMASAFSLKPGEWTELNDGPGAHVFLHVVKHGRRELSEVTAPIERKLQNQKLKDEIASLKKKTGIWMDETYFASKTQASGSKPQPEAPGQSKSSADRGER
jgi:hypothetical protein